MKRRMHSNLYRLKGFSLVELLVVIAIVAIPVLAVGILMTGGFKSYKDTYESVHAEINEDVRVLTSAFGSVGRKSNRSNYTVYWIKEGQFIEAQPLPNHELAVGQAVEFRYWDQPFDPTTVEEDALEATNTGDRYALFYLDDDELKVDYGTVTDGIGAVSGNTRNTANIVTYVLAHHVDLTGGSGIFSHSVIGGQGSGSVRLHLVLTDDEGRQAEIKTSTLLRIIWPQ